VVQSPVIPAIFQTRIEKNNKANSVRVILICSDHSLILLDSYIGVDRALTSDESVDEVFKKLFDCMTENL